MIDRSIGPPHVTDILAAVGLIDTEWFRQYDLERGSAVHAATHYLDDRDLAWESVDPVIVGRLRSYQRFLDEVKPEILAAEEAVLNEAMQYQGTLDRRLRINGREGVLDIKGPSRAPWQALQVAMYAACFTRPLARWTLHLSDDRYNLIEHHDRNDWRVACAAITLAAWKGKQNGH
jgi:hypothetical protein